MQEVFRILWSPAVKKTKQQKHLAIRSLGQQTTDGNESLTVSGTCLSAGRFKELTVQ